MKAGSKKQRISMLEQQVAVLDQRVQALEDARRTDEMVARRIKSGTYPALPPRNVEPLVTFAGQPAFPLDAPAFRVGPNPGPQCSRGIDVGPES